MLCTMDQKLELKEEPVSAEATASTSFPVTDVKHEIFIEEQSVDQLVCCFKEESNSENKPLHRRGLVDSYCKVLNSGNELMRHLSTDAEEMPHEYNMCTEDPLSLSEEGPINSMSASESQTLSCTSGMSKTIDNNELINVCKECGKTFTSKSNLTQHLSYHTGERRHCCEQCGKLFSRKSNLKQHLLIHSQERPYKCNECGKAFNIKSHLRAHMNSHGGEKRNCCNECGHFFARPSVLRAHLLTHSGERPHPCNICGGRFSRKSALKRHMRKHTGQRPYICHQCGTSYARKISLKGHMLIHSADKECGKTVSPNCL